MIILLPRGDWALANKAVTKQDIAPPISIKPQFWEKTVGVNYEVNDKNKGVGPLSQN